MSSSYDQNPGRLNLSFSRGDTFSAMVDFSIQLFGYTVTASIQSLVDGSEVQPLTVSMASQTEGQVNVSLTNSQTLSLPRGTYGWSMRWNDGLAHRTALTGIVEVL